MTFAEIFTVKLPLVTLSSGSKSHGTEKLWLIVLWDDETEVENVKVVQASGMEPCFIE